MMPFYIVVFVNIKMLNAQIADIHDFIKEVAKIVNGCTDQYTFIDLEANYDSYAYYKSRIGTLNMLGTVSLFAYLFVLVALILYIVATCCH